MDNYHISKSDNGWELKKQGATKASITAPTKAEIIQLASCSGLMKPDTHLGENARQIEVSDDQTTPLLYS